MCRGPRTHTVPLHDGQDRSHLRPAKNGPKYYFAARGTHVSTRRSQPVVEFAARQLSPPIGRLSVQPPNLQMTDRVLFLVVTAIVLCVATPRHSTAGQPSTLRGRITQAQDPNLPVPRARVSIELPNGDTAVAHADENGRYEVPVPVQGAVVITVTKSSYLRATFRHTSRAAPVAGGPRASAAMPSFDVQMVKAGVITGRVVDSSGQPIMGAGVRAWRTTGPPGGNRAIGIPAVSNDLGEFRIAGLMAGSYELSAFFDFEARAQLRENDVDRVPPTGPPPEVLGTIRVLADTVVVDVAVGEDVSVTLRQQTGTTFGMQPQGDGVIAGRILDNVGEPIAGARVRLWRAPPTGSGLLAQKGPAAITDDLGRYRLSSGRVRTVPSPFARFCRARTRSWPSPG